MNSVVNQRTSSACGDSGFRRNMATRRYVAEDDSVTLCPVQLLTNSHDLCYMDEELRRPTKASLIQFVLPNKIHFRYCWLFSGIPTLDHYASVGGADPLIDREYVERNRILMTERLPGSRHSGHAGGASNAMKAFWLTSDGKLVYVTDMSEDMKFRTIRARNRSLALALWTANPELCGETMKACASAYSNLIRLCTDASLCSSGRFYNLYATYPLPVQDDTDARVLGGADAFTERSVRAFDIHHGEHLVNHLNVMYERYFAFMADETTSAELSDRVDKLGARWLVDHDRNEAMFSTRVKHNWWTRLCVKLTMLVSAW